MADYSNNTPGQDPTLAPSGEAPNGTPNQNDFASAHPVEDDSSGGSDNDADDLKSEEKHTAYMQLSTLQRSYYDNMKTTVKVGGKFTPGDSNGGADYGNPASPQHIEKNMRCGTCFFYDGTTGCEIVSGTIDHNGLCRLYLIPNNKMKNVAKRLKETISDIMKSITK